MNEYMKQNYQQIDPELLNRIELLDDMREIKPCKDYRDKDWKIREFIEKPKIKENVKQELAGKS